MSKNELRIIARIMLTGVGLYILIQMSLTILLSAASMPMLVSSQITPWPLIIIVSLCIYAALAIVTVYFLFRCANRISAKIVEPEPVDETQVSWLSAAFRLVCVTAGVLFLYWSVPNLIVTVGMYISNMSNEAGRRTIYTGMSSKTDIAKYAVMLGLSIYMAFGAPGFVRWQVRKTLKQCRRIDEQQPALN